MLLEKYGEKAKLLEAVKMQTLSLSTGIIDAEVLNAAKELAKKDCGACRCRL